MDAKNIGIENHEFTIAVLKVEYLHQQYHEKSHEEIKMAIKDFGPMRADIEKELRK